MEMRHVVIAPCSRRKRSHIDDRLQASTLPPAGIDRLAEVWLARLTCSPPVMPAEKLYAGRGLVEARHAAAALQAPLRIVSAGLGLIDSNRAVPAYSLTVAAGDPDSVESRVLGPFSSGLWWNALHNALGMPGGSMRDLMSEHNGLAILALPGSYLELVSEEIMALPATALSRVRLVGPPREAVKPQLSAYWMPYDYRFDGPGGPNPGTRADFAQRAARHFAERVVRASPAADAGTHAAMVEQYLRPLSPPAALRREVGTDAELIEVIRRLLPESGGRSGLTLMLLRRQAGRACEQGRFRRLFAAAMRAELS